jgi:hypothetical protein
MQRKFFCFSVFLFFCFFVFLFFCFLVIHAEASITLKVMAVNPSSTLTQKVPVKAYLPKEVKPEDIIDKGDLDVAYDTQTGSYYVFGEYELKPQEVMEWEIEIKDIWIVSESEIESLRLEAERIKKLLENTKLAERIEFIYAGIERKLNEVKENQKVPAASPAQHISNYRHNAQIVESVKKDLVLARSLLAQVRPSLGGATWKLIVFIVAFLGILGLSFYVIWQRQAKVSKEVVLKEETASEARAAGQRHEAKKEEEGGKGIDDIEKIIREEE